MLYQLSYALNSSSIPDRAVRNDRAFHPQAGGRRQFASFYLSRGTQTSPPPRLYSDRMHSEQVKIKQVDAMEGDKVIVTLSDGRVFVVTLQQLMSLHLELLPVEQN